MTYGYDRNGDILYKQDNVVPQNSELYHANSTTSGDSNTAYDGLGRVTSFARGVLSFSGNNAATLDQIASPSTTESWSPDAFGNWKSQSTGDGWLGQNAPARSLCPALGDSTSATHTLMRR